MMIASLLFAGGVALAGLPAHPVYLNLDGRYYRLNGNTTGTQPVLRNAAGARLIEITDPTALMNCRRAGGGQAANTPVLMFYENNTKLVYLVNDRTRWRYAFGDTYNVFFLESSNGDTICDGEVPPPVPAQAGPLFRDGFEG